MRETKFIQQNKRKWAGFEKNLERQSENPEELNELFVQVTDDLSYARTFYPNRSVRVYLNGLGQKIFFSLYKNRKREKGRFKHFVFEGLPQLVYESRKEFRTAFLVFVLSMAIGVLSCVMNEDFAAIILGESYVEMTLENIENNDPMAVYKAKEEGGMFAVITANNLRVALLTFAMGALYAVGTLLILIKNGIMVGAFQYFFLQKDNSEVGLTLYQIALPAFILLGLVFKLLPWFLRKSKPRVYEKYKRKFFPALLLTVFSLVTLIGLGLITTNPGSLFVESFLTIWIHGTLEISAIIIAGAAGLTMGRGLIFPGTLSRIKAFQLSARRGLKIMVGIIPIIIAAGFIEGFFTRYTETPDIIRLFFILSCLAFILFYFVYYPWAKAQRGFDSDLRHSQLSPDNTQQINYRTIKSNGTIFSEVFVFAGRYLGDLVKIAAGVTVFYLLITFTLSEVSPFDTFRFSNFMSSNEPGALQLIITVLQIFFGSLGTAGQFFDNTHIDLLPAINSFTLATLATFTLPLLVRNTRREKEITEKKNAGYYWLLFSKMLIPAAAIAFFFNLGEVYVYFFGVAVIPLLLLWMYIMAYENVHIFVGFKRVFKLISGNFWRVVGLGATLILLGMLTFMFSDSIVFFFIFDFIGMNLNFAEETMSNISAVLLTGVGMFFIHLILAVLCIGVGMLYHTLVEIKEAPSLSERVENIGEERRLQGMARE